MYQLYRMDFLLQSKELGNCRVARIEKPAIDSEEEGDGTGDDHEEFPG